MKHYTDKGLYLMSDRSKQLTWCSYGFGELGISACESFVRIFLLLFYVNEMGLNPGWAGVAISVGIVWDAITDPLVGWCSDYLQPKLGRHWFIIAGTFVLAVSLAALFNPLIVMEEKLYLAGYLLTIYCLFNLGLTFVSIPYHAIGGEFSRDAREITMIQAYKFIFGNIGVILAISSPSIMSSWFSVENNTSYLNAAAMLVATICVFSILITVLSFARRKVVSTVEVGEEIPKKSQYKLWSNQCFYPLFCAIVAGMVAITIHMSAGMYYFKYRLLLSDSQAQLMMTIFFVAMCVSVPVWLALSRRVYHSHLLFYGCGVLGLLFAVIFPFLPEKSFYITLLFNALAGLAAGSVCLIEVLLIDVVFYDQVKTRRNRLGLYYGVWKMGGKISRSVALLLIGQVLLWIGFDPEQVVTAKMANQIGWCFGLGVGLPFLLAATMAWFYPLSPKIRIKIMNILVMREATQNHLSDRIAT